MDTERTLIRKLLPQAIIDRIDTETYSIRLFLEQAAQEISPGAIVLDAGAGYCPYRYLFSHTTYIALDFAQGEITWDYSHVDILANLKALPIRENFADVVICTQVLEHVPEPLQILKELQRVLKPGGILYLTAPQAFGEHQEPYDFFRFTSFGLRYLSENAGFDVDYIKPRGGFFWFFSVMLLFLHDRLFPDTRSRFMKVMFLPFQCFSAIIFLLISPVILYSLDFIDKRKDITLGYALKARK